MKKIASIIVLLLSLSFMGCSNFVQKDESTSFDPSVKDEVFTENNPYQEDFSDSSAIPPSSDNEESTQTEILPIEPEKTFLNYAVSKVDGLRVRTKPDSKSTTLGYLDKNDAVEIIGENENYYQTVFKEQKAYVHKSYCNILKIQKSDDKSEKAIKLGTTLLGHPYVWGSQRYHWGNGKLNTNFIPGEFDCSALVQYIYYKSNNVLLDTTTRTQVKNGTEIKREDLKRGDLMFFTNASRKNLSGRERIGHVGIYFGNNYILHTASDHAVIEPISNTRWSYYITARRVV